jgi:NAD(P)-dependent dehydrogenase (short-subunit alcohol dehydrogenase family)
VGGVDASGTVVAAATLRRSNEPYFNEHVPFRIGAVRPRCGSVVLAFLTTEVTGLGQRVKLANELSHAGEAVFVAFPAEGFRDTNIMSDPNRIVKGKNVLITGAAGGIGTALVQAFQRAGAGAIYAGMRRGEPIQGSSLVAMDVTSPEQLRSLAGELGDRLDIIVNNAGFNANSSFLSSHDALVRREIETNYYGPLNVVRAFSPSFKARESGVFVNVLSVLSHVNLPTVGSYCASKAAAFSLTQALRAELMPFGVRVCGIFPPVVDTGMSTHIPPPKLSPREVADALIEQIRDGIEDCYPGMAAAIYERVQQSPKAIEREMAERYRAGLQRKT